MRLHRWADKVVTGVGVQGARCRLHVGCTGYSLAAVAHLGLTVLNALTVLHGHLSLTVLHLL